MFVRTLGALALAFALAAPVAAVAQTAADKEAQAQAERQRTQPLNNAPMWGQVRSGDPGYTTVKGRETGVLVQTAGQTWREARVPISTIGGLLIGFVALVLLGYYSWRGSIGVHGKPTGRYIQRFRPIERWAHWTMGISFVILGITGLILTFGKHVLIPVIGYTLFAWLANAAKIAHNFVSPLFLIALPVFIVLFVRDNVPKAHDIKWIAKAGGMLDKSGGHVPSGRFNAGEKALFWLLVCTLCVVLAVSGLVLLFPTFDQTRATMALANTVHMVAGLLGIAMASFHIYLGTVGMRGAYQAMRYGYVDEAWAKEHHEIWYEDVKAGKARQRVADSPDRVPSEVAAALQTSH
jgi:formate dehydrogenase subunit gamma